MPEPIPGRHTRLRRGAGRGSSVAASGHLAEQARHHLPGVRLAAVVDGMRARGLIGASGWLSDAGRDSKERIESLTDDLAAAAYASLEPSELDQLIADLEPISAALDAAGSR